MTSLIHSTGTLHHRNRGFALVVTLALMILLTVIAVGLLGLSSISLRASAQGSAASVARANARMALMLALGDLQKYSGPDQRVTAAAEIRGATVNSKWTGVWSTTTVNKVNEPMVGGYVGGRSPQYFSDKRTSLRGWKDSLRLAWLVSGTAPANPAAVADPIELVGKGTLGNSAPSKDLVTVPRVLLGSASGVPTGGYAYWVGDESLKARIDQGYPDAVAADRNTPANGGYNRLAGADGPGFATVKSGINQPYQPIDVQTSVERRKIVSQSSISLALGNSSARDLVKPNFHDITTKSAGVLADVRVGSLRKDLGAYLESGSSIPAVAGIAGTGIAAAQPILPGPAFASSGPSFEHFKKWYDLRNQITGALGSGVISPQFINSRADAAGGYNEGFTTDVMQKTQPVQPVLADFRLAFDFSLDPGRGAGRAVRYHLYPRVTLWNPYNVTLRATRYLVGITLPAIGNNVEVDGKRVVAIAGDPNSGRMVDSVVNAESVIYFTTAPIDFAPGECLVFSPDYAASAGSPKIGGNSARYDSTNIGANVLSANVPAGQNNFHFNTGFAVDGSVTLTGSPGPSYGVRRDVNAAISNGLNIVLKRAPSGSISYASLRQQDCATIATMRMDYNGKKTSWWWNVYALNTEPVNNAAFPGFVDYQVSPNRYPPRLWYTQGRLRWLDENDELQALGQQWGKGAGLLYNNPVIGHFNVRAPGIFRSQFCFYDDWTRYAPGPTMIPWVTPRLGDPRLSTPYNNGKSMGSPFGLPSEWGAVRSYALFDLPQKGAPLFSLASLQHCQLGFYGWHPSYVVGNSLAEPRSDRTYSAKSDYFDASVAGTAWGDGFAKHTPGVWPPLIQDKMQEVLAHDIAFGVNQLLWDRYFFSTIPNNSGTTAWDPETTPLPNTRLVATKPAEARNLLSAGKPFDYAAYFLMNHGAFNVNSTSVEAWRAFLSSLNRVSRPTASGEGALHTFSRLLVPRTASNPGAAGGGSQTRSSAAWEGARTLTDAEIEKLATQMVAIVKARGPFLGMADFVNRRLASPGRAGSFDDESYCGALQAAIEKAGINSPLQAAGDETSTDIGNANTGGGTYKPDATAYFKYKTYGAPGYLTQADVLQTIGQNLTTRGDTFVIRAYGEARDATGQNVLARAYCEATVQRTPEYLLHSPPDSTTGSDGNNPLEPVCITNAGSLALTANSKLLPLNAKFGRRFNVVDFRWLDPSEI